MVISLLTFRYGVVYPPYKKGGSSNASILHEVSY